MIKIRVIFLFLLALLFFGNTLFALAKKEKVEKPALVVYSARQEHLIKPLFEAYEKEAGIKIQFITDKEAPLIERLKAEGERTSSDLLITVDAGNLWYAAKEGVLQRVESEVLRKNIPSQFRDPENMWFGLSLRARTVVYNTKKVISGELSTYEDLSNKKWKKRLCLRTAKKVYNQSLVAMMLDTLGPHKTERIVHGWVKNLAAPVFADDTAVLEAIAAGQCDVGMVNTYYFGRLMHQKPGLPLAIFWPNQTGRGAHVNISGAGVTKHAKHPKEASAFLEWLSSDKAQNLFADSNLEYPANPKVAAHPTVAAWGMFKQDTINVAKAGELQMEAIKLMDRAGYK